MMDTSDTSDFESADEFFSDTEDVPEKDNLKGGEDKTSGRKIQAKEWSKILEPAEEDIQRPVQCWEPGMDYEVDSVSTQKNDAILDKVIEKIDTVIVNEDNSEEGTVNIVTVSPVIISNEPEIRIPAIRTTCWIPELNEANIKRESSDFVPGPPKFDRDGNPIIYRDSKCTEIQEKEDNANSREESENDKVSNVSQNDAKRSSEDVQTHAVTIFKMESPTSTSMRIPRATCWVPALNEANKKRRENEKNPPKPPTVDRDGNLIIHKVVEKEKNEKPALKKAIDANKANLWDTDETCRNYDNIEIKKDVENKTDEHIKEISSSETKNVQSEKDRNEESLWDNNDQWEIEDEPVLSKDLKLTEEVTENQGSLWKDDLGAWGDADTWTNQDSTADIQQSSSLKKPLNKIDVKPPSKPDSSISSDDNMWENEQWESVENEPGDIRSAFDNLANKNQQQSWSSWGNWGISSVLNTVSQGLTTVIGVPDPEELARQHLMQKELQTDKEHKEVSVEEFAVEKDTSESGDSFVGLGTLVSGVTKLVETTGTKVISGGLGTLETIGKKTMEVLQENDPGLKKKRAFLKKIEPEKPVLSQILKEAKEKADMSGEVVLGGTKKERAVDYEILFDDYQGLVHIEALSMLSRQCSIKLTTVTSHLTGLGLTDLQETLDQVKELCELPTTEDSTEQTISPTEFHESILTALVDLNVPISFAGLVKAWESLELGDSAKGVYRNGVETLAKFTAIAAEQMHKGGEMLLVKEHRSTVDEADSLVQISTMVISMLNTISTVFTDKLNEFSTEETKEEINQYITNIFIESSNSIQYVRQAFQLLIPVLQVGAT